MDNERSEEDVGASASAALLAGDATVGMPRASDVYIRQNGWFVCKLSLKYGNNFSPESDDQSQASATVFGLSARASRFHPSLQPGDVCYPIANILAGLNSYQASSGFIYDPAGGMAEYTISGTTLNPSWSGPNFRAPNP